MGQLDFIVMAVFALLILGIGMTFTRIGSKNSAAFFEAGGSTPWWINGLSLFISYFSAGTFVVWGSLAYKHGLVANTIQLTMAVSGLIVALFIAARWKRTGTATAAEYIGKRFGLNAQQFYTYLILILSLINTSAVLYPVGKMVYVATPFSLNTCIIAIGIIIVLYTAGFMLAFIGYQTVYIGGNWSYVQRYTSVSSERNAKKVAYLFSILYLVS